MLGDAVATQKLGHFVTEVVAVVFEQIICTRPARKKDIMKNINHSHTYTYYTQTMLVYALTPSLSKKAYLQKN